MGFRGASRARGFDRHSIRCRCRGPKVLVNPEEAGNSRGRRLSGRDPARDGCRCHRRPRVPGRRRQLRMASGAGDRRRHGSGGCVGRSAAGTGRSQGAAAGRRYAGEGRACEVRGRARGREGGEAATAFTRAAVSSARSVVIQDPAWGKWGGRVIADLIVDGRSLSAALIAAGHGRAYGGGKRGNWCALSSR